MFVARPDSEAIVRSALHRAPAVVILGARQVGKSTLARLIANRLDKKALYLDLEKQADRRRMEDAGDFLRMQKGRLVVIDEIHRSPHLFPELRGIIDEDRGNARFLLLGSASLDLLQQAAETLAGRVAYVDLDPFHVEETIAAGIDINDLWVRGGFPRSLLANTDAQSMSWREDFIATYLERDVPMFAPRMPAATVGRLWTMLANAQGTMLNQARFAGSLGVSAPAVGRYVELLVDLKLVRRLQPWSGNLKKRLTRSPKVYVRDSGLVHALLSIGTYQDLLGHPVSGFSWEGLVIENLIAAAGPRCIPLFYRTADGAEIDLVIEKAGKPALAVEVKLGTAPKVEHGFVMACDDIGIRNRILVYGGADTYNAKGGVTVMPLLDAIRYVRKTLGR